LGFDKVSSKYGSAASSSFYAPSSSYFINLRPKQFIVVFNLALTMMYSACIGASSASVSTSRCCWLMLNTLDFCDVFASSTFALSTTFSSLSWVDCAHWMHGRHLLPSSARMGYTCFFDQWLHFAFIMSSLFFPGFATVELFFLLHSSKLNCTTLSCFSFLPAFRSSSA